MGSRQQHRPILQGRIRANQIPQCFVRGECRFPKQLMVAALANALRAGQHGNLAGSAKIKKEFQSMLEAGNNEGL